MGNDNPTAIYIANTGWYLYNFRLDLIRAAAAAGRHPILVCPPDRHAQRLRELGYEVITLSLGNAGMHPVRELKVLAALCRLMRARRPQVAHLFTLKCVLYGCLASLFSRKTQPIAAVTGMGYLFTSSGWRVRLVKAPVITLLRFALRGSRARVVFQNEHDRDEFVARRLVPRERTHVIRGSGVDCDRFRPPAIDEPRTVPRLLFAARLLQEKGIREYLEAVHRLRHEGWALESWIAGEAYAGNPSSFTPAEVEALARNPAHTYLGHREDMPHLLGQVDIVVLPTYREGTPKILLEAAAMGRLIVTTDIPGCQGIVAHGRNGYLVEPRDTESLIAGLRKALALTPEERQRMGLTGREIAERSFSHAAVNEQTLSLYDAQTVEA